LTGDYLVTYFIRVMQDDVFKALADAHRRKLLDALFETPGLTLSELQALLPMTRFGCMKHLKVLEDAGLVATRKVGREKLHYVNPVTIQQVYDRWVAKYTAPWAAAMTALKSTLETTDMQNPTHVLEVFIRTTPDRLWQALTDGTMTRLYYFNATAVSTWEIDAPYTYAWPDGTLMLSGKVLDSVPPRKLVTTFQPHWSPDATPSKVTYEISKDGPICKLTVIHEDLDPQSSRGILSGWNKILSSLKSLLETGEALQLKVG
jgi:uncharacterized protein YndB with AHSA1/START domain/DNA-binding transcriptional ArsR family regulator